jgi:hypothetical protein
MLDTVPGLGCLGDACGDQVRQMRPCLTAFSHQTLMVISPMKGLRACLYALKLKVFDIAEEPDAI